MKPGSDSRLPPVTHVQGLLRLALFLTFFLHAGCASYMVVSGGRLNRDKLQEIQRELVRLRGLDFRAEVPIEVKDREEMRRYLDSQIEAEYGAEKLGHIALAYSKLGLFPPDFDLRRSLLDFYEDQLIAFYDPVGKKLVLPEDLGGGLLLGAYQLFSQRDVLGEIVLAHELTHALQDQHFSLKERLDPLRNQDSSLAMRAVAEGDATLSGFAILFGFMDEDLSTQANEAVRRSIGGVRSSLSEIPRAVLEELLFQYYGGLSFVSRWLSERGWLGVNRIYASPPLSTEQVLHPEKYVVAPDPPTRVELSNLSSVVPSDWEEIENNVLGELMVQVLFREFLSEEEARTAATGWDGDRFVAFRRGAEVSFVWATVWDSAGDAEEFFRGYQEILKKKYGGSEAASLHGYAEQRGPRVLVVEGMPKEWVTEHMERISEGMELKEEPFTRPFPPLYPAQR